MKAGIQLMFLFALTLNSGGASAAPFKICIDPGHGGSDPGAVGCGLEEATITLDVAKRLSDLMKADPDLNPIMTRTSDVDVSLGARCAYANDNGADRFASIHSNAFNGSGTGIETFCYTYGSSQSIDQRNKIQKEMTTTWPALTDRGVKTAGFYVIKHTDMPATLSELAFIDNCSLDAKYLADPDERQAAAIAHLQAIRKSLGLGATDPVAPQSSGKLLGAVFEDKGMGPADMSIRLPGAKVTITAPNGAVENTTAGAEDGMWTFTLKPGKYTVSASLAGYWKNSRVCEVLKNQDTWCSIGLIPMETEEPAPDDGTLIGTVFQDQGTGSEDMTNRLSGAKVLIAGPNGFSVEAFALDQEAMWTVAVPPGTYEVTASYPDHYDNARLCEVFSENETWCSIGLFPKPGVDPVASKGNLTGVVSVDWGPGSQQAVIPLPHSLVSISSDAGIQTSVMSSKPDSAWALELPPGVYEVTASHAGFFTETHQCQLFINQQSWCNIALIPEKKNDPDAWWVPEAGLPDLFGLDLSLPGESDAEGGDPFVTPSDSDAPSGSSGCSSSSPTGSAGFLLLAALVAFLALLRRRPSVLLLLLLLAPGCQEPRETTACLLLPLNVSDPVRVQDAPVAAVQSEHSQFTLLDASPVTDRDSFQQPIWSADGGQLAFAGPKFATLHVLAQDGTVRLVAQGRGSGRSPAWTAAGLAYRHPGQRSYEIPALWAAEPHEEGAPSNPTPGYWAFVSNAEVYFRSGDETRLVSPPSDRYCCAHLSPDARFVVFLGLQSGLYVHDWRSETTYSLGLGTHPSISADSTLLFFDRCLDDGEQLTSCQLMVARLDLEPPEVSPISGAPAMAQHPALSPAGWHLAFDKDGAIWVGTLAP